MILLKPSHPMSLLQRNPSEASHHLLRMACKNFHDLASLIPLSSFPITFLSLCFNHIEPLSHLEHDKYTHLSYPVKVLFHEAWVLAMMCCACVYWGLYNIDVLLWVIISKKKLEKCMPRHSPESDYPCWWRIENSLNLYFNILCRNLSNICNIVAYQKQTLKNII